MRLAILPFVHSNLEVSEMEELGAVLAIIVCPRTGRIPLVIDHGKPEPHYYKFPGGKIEPIDIDSVKKYDDQLMADRATCREAKEETGIDVRIVERLPDVRKRTHTLYARICVGDIAQMCPRGDEGEYVRAFSPEQILVLPNFLPQHRQFFDALLAKAQIKVP
jgi:8-oxo-dGTP pyrophosphatase MutT (NUDIX family)